ncbi:protein brother [Caerostris darwini]|uniref:Protein brother n=1 Tax=Caerostris darwini TaxID=1538125 RepID=A0AAV4R9Q4_9ARAC|nr:protein brother [Caerostris darwini]
MLPFDSVSRFLVNMPRVVMDQKAKFESDDLFKKLSRESEVRYTGHKDRPMDERRLKFKTACREGFTEIAFVGTGINFQLFFGPYTDGCRDRCEFEQEKGKLKSERTHVSAALHMSLLLRIPGVYRSEPCYRSRSIGLVNRFTPRGHGRIPSPICMPIFAGNEGSSVPYCLSFAPPDQLNRCALAETELLFLLEIRCLSMYVHLRSSFIMNGVCVRWKGTLDLDRLDGVGCLEFDEELARLEDVRLQQQIEAYNNKVQELESKQRNFMPPRMKRPRNEIAGIEETSPSSSGSVSN